MNEKHRHEHTTARSALMISKKGRVTVIVAFTLMSIAAISLCVWTINNSMSDWKPGRQRGVGADGFQAYVEDKANLGVDTIVKKDQVTTALKNLASSVEDAKIAPVFTLNGNLGQTITFSFVRKDGVKSSVYVDKRVYKSKEALDDDHVYDATMESGKAKGHTIYFREAQTIGKDREYSLMVVDGKTVYRYVMSQTYNNISVTELTALVTLKKLAQVSNL